MPSRTRTTTHRPARLAAVLTAVLAGLLLSLVAVLPATATPPFALPDQITDQVGAVEGHTGEIRAALDDLSAEHGIRIWVVFVDTFDGVDPQAWADRTFTATGLGTEDYLLAVAMGDRQYGYVVDQAFVLDDAALARVASAAERHLAENPARAVTTAAARMAIEPSAPRDSQSGGQPVAYFVAGLAVVVLLGFLYMLVRVSRMTARSLQNQADDQFFGQPRDYDEEAWRRESHGSFFGSSSAGSTFFGGSHDTWSDSGGSSGGGGGGGTRGGSGSI